MNTHSEEPASPIDVLNDFFGTMHEWELRFYKQLRSMLETDSPQTEVEALQARARAELTEIFDKFSIEGKKNRLRIDGLGLSDPPTYENVPDVQHEVTVEQPNSAVFLVNKTTGPRGTYKYTLKKKSEKWILTKREFSDIEGNWRPFSF